MSIRSVRVVLTAALGASVALVVGACSSEPDPSAGCVELRDGTCVVETFRNPPLATPNAAGAYELTLGPTVIELDGKRYCGRAYNGKYGGPTIETKARVGPGERQVRVNLRNAFTRSDYRELGGKTCTCADSATGASCSPGSGHGGHGGHESSCVCKDKDGATCHYFDFNLTNLHAHGSHVRPDYATGGGCKADGTLGCRSCKEDGTGEKSCYYADDVLSQIAPGAGAQHRWDIDEDETHHDGLNWYHPHIHGSTAIQVVSGAAGAWIVRGPLDELPGIKNARERIIVFSTPPIGEGGFTPLAEGEPCDEEHVGFNSFELLGDTAVKQANVVNGLQKPRMIMAPGQIERWRFLSASYLDEAFIGVFKGKDTSCSSWDVNAPVALTQIARDGITLPRPPLGNDWPFAPSYLFMSPGYRIDAILDGNELADGDNLCVVTARFLQEAQNGPKTDGPVGLTTPTEALVKDRFANGSLTMIVNVTAGAGAPTETKRPDYAAIARLAPSLALKGGTVDANARCAAAQAERDISKIDQVVTFQVGLSTSEGFDSCGCSDHNVNCKNFERRDRKVYPYDRVLTKDSVEHWRLFSFFDGHPFHIHINPYVVCPLPPAGSADKNTKGRIFQEPPFAHFRDTYLVNLDRTVDILSEYRTFTGSFVFHCHKLIHEDHGMMELMKVCDPAVEECGKLCAGKPCGWNQCADGDEHCRRAIAATRCVIDPSPSRCSEAASYCLQCDNGPCPPNGGTCGSAGFDGKKRCVPPSP